MAPTLACTLLLMLLVELSLGGYAAGFPLHVAMSLWLALAVPLLLQSRPLGLPLATVDTLRVPPALFALMAA